MRVFAGRLFWLVPVGLACLLAGCGSSNSAYVNPHNSPPNTGNSAFIKVFNASLEPIQPDMGGPFKVNVKVGDTVVAKNLPVGYQLSTYVPVDAGANRTIQISVLESQPVSETIQQTLAQNQYYTLITTIANSGPQATILQDDLTPPASGDAKIRIVHEADMAGPVDIYITAPNVNINDPANPIKPTLSNVAVGSASAYLEVPAGSYRIRVTGVGDPSNVIIDNLPADLAAGDIYTGVTLDPHGICYPGDYACAALVMGYRVFLTQDQPVAGVTPVAPAM